MTPGTALTIQQFQAKWRTAAARLNERQAAQSHFNDLCDLLGVAKPADSDPAVYAFEKGAEKLGGGKGFADVWRKGYFAWEYKGAHADLDAAYRQLQLYRDFLDNPPLLVVCDLDRFVVYTNFTDTKQDVHRFGLEDLDQPAAFDVLRRVFTDPQRLKPGVSREDVTQEAAARFGALARSLQDRGTDAQQVAHFLVQLLFCLFAEDIGLLPKGLFTNLLTFGAKRPEQFEREVGALFAAMAGGGFFALNDVPHFNGGLFHEIRTLRLTGSELTALAGAAALDWGNVEPAIFGTLFERSLDPGSRAQLGAHYTGRADIERVVEPVLMSPLRRRWATIQAEADTLKAAWTAAATPRTRDNRRAAFAAKLGSFQDELRQVKVLDPACGSGNFLYVALAKLLDLEKEVLAYGAANGLPLGYPQIGPDQLLGLEVNEYARELAQVVVWIGYLQWMIGNGFTGLSEPILKPLDTIRLQDALLDRSEPGQPKEAAWPAADVIIGNPPFLGGKRLRSELSDEYVNDLFAVYEGRQPREADLVCYFFEKARAQLASHRLKRAGLLATQAIRFGFNRRVLDRIKGSGDIFLAWDDEPWVINGADVRISIVGFDDGSETDRSVDGGPVATINSDLSSTADLSGAQRLPENAGIGFQGPVKVGPFELDEDLAQRLLRLPLNPNGRPNSDVIRPWANGLDVMRRSRSMHVIDFGTLTIEQAALYEAPFEYVRTHVKPFRDQNRDRQRRTFWWRLGRSGEDLREATQSLGRFVVTPRVARHRIFVWVDAATLPDSRLFAFAREDDYFFGIVHSRAHEVWSLRTSSRHGVGNDPTYNLGTCFETFPLPWPPGQEPRDDPRVAAVADAAQALDEARRRWLDPPNIPEAELKQRTLTNLYNQRPTWLAHLHAALDRAVWAAYGWEDYPSETADEAILSRLLALNLERADAAGL